MTRRVMVHSGATSICFDVVDGRLLVTVHASGEGQVEVEPADLDRLRRLLEQAKALDA